MAEGAGLAGLFATSGALVVVRRPGSAPTSEELLRAVRDTGAAAVVVVPDGAQSLWGWVSTPGAPELAPLATRLAELERIARAPKLSRDTYEQVTRSLG